MKKQTGLCFLVVVVVLAALGMAGFGPNSGRPAFSAVENMSESGACLSISSVGTRSPSYKVGDNCTCTAYVKVVGSASWQSGDASENGTVTITGTIDWMEGTTHVSGSGSITRTIENDATFAEPGCPNWFDLPIGIWASGQLGGYYDVTISIHLDAPNGAGSDISTTCPVFLYR
jgi:hypothetical protein